MNSVDEYKDDPIVQEVSRILTKFFENAFFDGEQLSEEEQRIINILAKIEEIK